MSIFKRHEWVVMRNHPLAEIDDPLTSAIVNLKPFRSRKLLANFHHVAAPMGKEIEATMGERFGLMFDGWTNGQSAAAHVEMIANVLAVYKNHIDMVCFIVGDNCSTNQAIAERLNVPLLAEENNWRFEKFTKPELKKPANERMRTVRMVKVFDDRRGGLVEWMDGREAWEKLQDLMWGRSTCEAEEESDASMEDEDNRGVTDTTAALKVTSMLDNARKRKHIYDELLELEENVIRKDVDNIVTAYAKEVKREDEDAACLNILTQHNYQLLSLMVVDDNGEGQIVQHSLLERNAYWHMSLALSHFVDVNPGVEDRAQAIMVDKDLTEIKPHSLYSEELGDVSLLPPARVPVEDCDDAPVIVQEEPPEDIDEDEDAEICDALTGPYVDHKSEFLRKLAIDGFADTYYGEDTTQVHARNR
ncbi:hypothetical protein ATCC90586_001679 [Pythium insidiosum]|nr:hypothetical protein ATCC90586_001679 [Pythium insidiosum]